MKLKSGNIIAGKCISNIYLGWDEETLKKIIGNNYSIEERINCKIWQIENAKFWIDDSNKIYQITVFDGFEGRFLNKIGIGSTLKDVETFIGKWQDNLDVYVLPSYEGICFELKDDENWDELNTPIEFISIYR